MVEDAQLLSTLKEYFGYESFRPLQKKIINSIFAGEDNLVIMPTGGGKSICFQLPALLLPGVTLVISPLIALMKDQVDGLAANGVSAAFLNSSQSEQQQQEIFERLAKNEIKMLYLAPESLQLADRVFNHSEVSLIAIDEAHCISSWGHDFRPAYTQLGYLKKRFPTTPLIALTATADKATRKDICRQLNIPGAKIFIASFDRKNLSLEVRPGTKKFEQIISFLKGHRQESGIIYCLSRKSTEQLAVKLRQSGYNAASYHAGLAHEERSSIQEDFINDNTQIICATIAFGMGIDKSNVRWIIHYNLPKNLEGYYQEIGRAGRDGLPSSTLLFHSYADVVQLQKFAQNSGNAEVQLAKLERMKQYSEALNCRRKILLGYFGEMIKGNCGNCDICKNPPEFFDGTVIAQKALSTIYRLKEQEPLSVIIDVLRGSHNTVIHGKGYQEIKTFGIGKETSWHHWQQYMIQLINHGLIEIAFDDQNRLRLTTSSRPVLFENESVLLAKVPEKKVNKAVPVEERNASTDNLFERLRMLRLKISKEENLPAYLIFNDATLKEMEKLQPETDEDFMQINGVGRQKMQNYGYKFIREIISFKKNSPKKKTRKKGNTFKATLELYHSGLSIEEMAERRKLSRTTIYSHLTRLFNQGEQIDLMKFVPAENYEAVKKLNGSPEKPEGLKGYFEYFEEAIPYGDIRLSLTILEKEPQSLAAGAAPGDAS